MGNFNLKLISRWLVLLSLDFDTWLRYLTYVNLYNFQFKLFCSPVFIILTSFNFQFPLLWISVQFFFLLSRIIYETFFFFLLNLRSTMKFFSCFTRIEQRERTKSISISVLMCIKVCAETKFERRKNKNYYWWNKGDRRGKESEKFIGKYWFICNHNIQRSLRTPTAIMQTFLFALCWNILTRAAFCLFFFLFFFFCSSRSSFAAMPSRILFTDLRTQWFFPAKDFKRFSSLDEGKRNFEIYRIS